MKGKVSKTAKRGQQAIWKKRFEELEKFEKKHGHCNVPRKHTTQLGQWVVDQRIVYKRGQLPKYREDLLVNIGFTWDHRDSCWEDQFEQLESYKREHGDCIVPRSYTANPQLGQWVAQQRRNYKNDKLSEERQCMLEEIGFTFMLKSNKRKWEDQFEKLKSYKLEHGDCNVPRRYTANPQLGGWVAEQRRNCNKDKLSEERINRLEALGFSWGKGAPAPVSDAESITDDSDSDEEGEEQAGRSVGRREMRKGNQTGALQSGRGDTLKEPERKRRRVLPPTTPNVADLTLDAGHDKPPTSLSSLTSPSPSSLMSHSCYSGCQIPPSFDLNARPPNNRNHPAVDNTSISLPTCRDRVNYTHVTLVGGLETPSDMSDQTELNNDAVIDGGMHVSTSYADLQPTFNWSKTKVLLVISIIAFICMLLPYLIDFNKHRDSVLLQPVVDPCIDTHISSMAISVIKTEHDSGIPFSSITTKSVAEIEQDEKAKSSTSASNQNLCEKPKMFEQSMAISMIKNEHDPGIPFSSITTKSVTEIEQDEKAKSSTSASNQSIRVKPEMFEQSMAISVIKNEHDSGIPFSSITTKSVTEIEQDEKAKSSTSASNQNICEKPKMFEQHDSIFSQQTLDPHFLSMTQQIINDSEHTPKLNELTASKGNVTGSSMLEAEPGGWINAKLTNFGSIVGSAVPNATLGHDFGASNSTEVGRHEFEHEDNEVNRSKVSPADMSYTDRVQATPDIIAKANPTTMAPEHGPNSEDFMDNLNSCPHYCGEYLFCEDVPTSDTAGEPSHGIDGDTTVEPNIAFQDNFISAKNHISEQTVMLHELRSLNGKVNSLAVVIIAVAFVVAFVPREWNRLQPLIANPHQDTILMAAYPRKKEQRNQPDKVKSAQMANEARQFVYRRKYERQCKMLKVGLPEGAILQSFIKDGIQDEDEQKEIMKILRGGD